MPNSSARKRILMGMLGLATAAAAGGFALQSQVRPQGAELLHEAVELIARESLDSLDAAALYEAAAEGLVRRLQDPYSELLSPKELERFSREAMGNYGGVGIVIEPVEGAPVVMQVYPGTPAARQGVQSGDRILAIAGESVATASIDQVSEKLRGAPGSAVGVEFGRGEGETFTAALARRRIQIPSVPFATLLSPDIGYIPIRRFSESTGREVEIAVRSLRGRGARSFVLDLRGNGGGALEQAILVGNLFLPQGTPIAAVSYRNQPEERYTAEREPVSLDAPLAVMIDERSASASEIVAGALQDHDRALVVGRRSFGKGLVQQLFRLEQGWVLKLTTGKWVTPSGRSLQRARDPRGIPLPEDSAATSSAPAFRTAAGRPILGDGGITPDLTVDPTAADPHSELLSRLIGRRINEFHSALSATAYEMRGRVEPDFRVDAAARQRLVGRLRANGIAIEPAQVESLTPLLDRLLAARISDRIFGESVTFGRQLPRDTQLQAVIERLRGASSAAALVGISE